MTAIEEYVKGYIPRSHIISDLSYDHIHIPYYTYIYILHFPRSLSRQYK